MDFTNIVVIDTETNWNDEVMSVGAVIADAETLQPVDSRYYIVTPEYRRGGMYSDVLRISGTPEPAVLTAAELKEQLNAWLHASGVDAVFAYNARFDMGHMPALAGYR